MPFAQLTLELESSLHIGSGRTGMIARSHGFVPGHLLTFALATVAGLRLGGRYADFERGLALIRSQSRCGPLLIAEAPQQLLYPQRDQERIEAGYLYAHNHATLNSESGSAVEGALFEVEFIGTSNRQGGGQKTQLQGGMWYHESELPELGSWSSLLEEIRLGGELKSGYGRVRLQQWQPHATQYAGLGTVSEAGLTLKSGEILPGPALQGVESRAWQPWLGRRFERLKGFGQQMSPVAMVQLDGIVQTDRPFLPSVEEAGLGCWQPQEWAD